MRLDCLRVCLFAKERAVLLSVAWLFKAHLGCGGDFKHVCCFNLILVYLSLFFWLP